MTTYAEIIVHAEQKAEAELKALPAKFEKYKDAEKLVQAEADKVKERFLDRVAGIEKGMDDAEKALEAKEAEIRYPLMKSLYRDDQLRGSIEYNSAMSTPPFAVEILADAMANDRADLISALAVRNAGIEPKDPEGKARKVQFEKLVSEYFRGKLGEDHPKARKAIEAGRLRADLAKKTFGARDKSQAFRDWTANN